MPYDPVLVQPFRDELTNAGVQELKTAAEVENAFEENKNTTMLVIVNSVCGCAAGIARPAIRKSLQNQSKPVKITSVFAGQDLEATAKARELFQGLPPSSPSIALFKNGELVHFVPRHRIEGRMADDITNELVIVFNKYCN
ncbi:MAG: BrxA/BrxB family bacilliredoxin [Bacteroidetes bacterium]|nr:BrxA/BrxB family bacilliredoxin [Bacteroidota bacterium]